MPQLLSSLINIVSIYDMIPFYGKNFIICLPINIFINLLITKMYVNEKDYSKNLRYIMIFIYFIKNLL